MAQPHKGDRRQIQARLPLPVYDSIRAAAAARGQSISQYVADRIATDAGHPELVSTANAPEELPLTA